jgi:hypothetical protein
LSQETHITIEVMRQNSWRETEDVIPSGLYAIPRIFDGGFRELGLPES